MKKIFSSWFAHKCFVITCSLFAIIGWIFCVNWYNELKLQFTIYHAIVLLTPFVLFVLLFSLIGRFIFKKNFVKSVMDSSIGIVIYLGVLMAGAFFISYNNAILKTLFFFILSLSLAFKVVAYILNQNRLYKEMKSLN
ncbi:hypothetical protein [Bacillus pseudomycoides]|uniref:hypothetical protein n=1 Tax=Bacillus pseudomycoides TaxID=64104 RepID=UPI000BF1A02E|nr:hypothetical protein [Bacillus pseudomycoides]PEK34082.1 hypothetical protein CN691_12740 [Bacillus pseudomycoides]